MNESGQLERLYQVQQLDLELDLLTTQEADISVELKDARAQQERINNDLEDAEIALEGVEKQARRLELDLATTQEQIGRNKAEQDKNATNAKMQSQYENVIQQLGERVADYEESLAPLYERQTALSARSTELRAEHRTLRPQLAALEDADEARVQALRETGQERRERRAAMVSEIEGRLVKEYELIRRSKKGLGIVPFEGGRCKGCNVQLPTNVQQRAALGKLPAVKCPSCGRFLIKLN
ncbi:zinc ribbon domain-containing protein [Deinococcus aquiradiocola]|uniref:DNA-binding protein n=1 Tax=Deinococcus aquiradiocola TaxID=393059 RepID=A0A917PD53_9DEIO|nr:C4-type zinc ribbon domain-containing protein [Deinococcus aquiradiocola]GGJ71380.1 DNA-binding protein [Deinococcus aquiradiocola]